MRDILFDVKTVDLVPNDSAYPNPDSRGIYREDKDDNGNILNRVWLGTVGNQFVPTKPKDMWKLMSEAVGLIDGMDDSCMSFTSFKGGQRYAIDVKLKDMEIIVPKKGAVVGDIVGTSLRFGTGLDGSKSNTLEYSLLRLACTNGMTTTERIKGNRFKNTKGAAVKIEELAYDITTHIKLKDELRDVFNDMAETSWINTKDNRDELYKRTVGFGYAEAEVAKGKSKQNVIDRLETSLSHEIGDIGANVWGMLNGITWYTNHEVVSKSRDNDVDNYISNQLGRTINDKAMKFALELV